MPSFPGPDALGRGIVVLAGSSMPPECESWTRITIDDAVVAEPRAAADQLHDLWRRRQRVAVVLATDPAALREAERCDRPPWQIDPSFEFSRERLQYLVWSNTYDLRAGEPIWWHGRRAERLGASGAGSADVVLPDGRPAWCDGGPRQPLTDPDGFAIVHREAVEAGSLAADRVAEPSAELAPDQLAAVRHDRGPARVIAPAGSGKTRVLAARLRHLLADRGWTPSTITAVAYNKRAADQLADRTQGLPAHIRTLNSLGLAIVNGSAPFRAAGAPARRVIEEREVREILETLLEVRRRQNTDPWATYIDALSAIRLGLASPSVVEDALPDATGIAEVFDRYRRVLTDRGLLDFDEQIYGAIETLLIDPDARVHGQRLARHLLVDEFQDLTPAHVVMLRLLAAPTYDVFGVGDDDQVIYSYAGASPEFLIDYERSFPGAAAYALEVNYRCPPAIVDAARHLLAYNDRRVAKTIRAAADEGTAADLVVERRPDDEHAQVAAEHIHRWADAGSAWSDMAVLARVNSALLPIQVTLIESGTPCTTPLGRSILTRTGIRAAFAYLRIGLAPDRIVRADVGETLRRPSRRIARNVADMLQKRPTTSIREIRSLAARLSGGDVAKLSSYADDLQAVADAVRRGSTAEALRVIRVGVGLGRAMDVLDDCRAEADRSTHADDLAALEQVAALHPDASTFESWLGTALARPGDGGGVTLSTVHRVKGQEWDHVVVLGADEGSFPHRLASDLEEERRVFHVAITRARADAVVVADIAAPSRFCAELTGTAPRLPQTPDRRPSPPSARPQPARAEGKKLPTHTPIVGETIRISGGYDAEIVEIGAGGVLAAPGGGTARMAIAWGAEVAVDGRQVRLVRPGTPESEAMVEALRRWRKTTADRDRVPAYIVFSDEHLEGIAAAVPGTLAELGRCRGIGPTKLDRYGDELLAVIQSAGDDPR